MAREIWTPSLLNRSLLRIPDQPYPKFVPKPALKLRGRRQFTAEQVREMRRLHSRGVRYAELAVRFDATVINVQTIVQGKTYAWVI